jgi:hypothetical protein
VHLRAEPLDIYLEEVFVDELRSFITALPMEILDLSISRDTGKAGDAAREVLTSMMRAPTLNTTIADPRDLFGKWCATNAICVATVLGVVAFCGARLVDCKICSQELIA